MKKALFVTGVNKENGGHVIAKRFAKEGYDVFVTARKQESADEVAAELMKTYNIFAKGYKLELRNDDSIYDIFKDIDSLGYFVETLCLNAADLGFFGNNPADGFDFFEMTPEQLQSVLEANVVGNFKIAQQAAIRMRENHKGAIVFISSNSVTRPNENRTAYITSKGGINALSKTMAVDLGKYGIRSNVVMPGTIKTQRWIGMGNKQISNGTMVPIGDISDLEDIANAVWYLGTEQSKNVTGTELVVDGGMTSQLFPAILAKYRAEEIAKMDGE